MIIMKSFIKQQIEEKYDIFSEEVCDKIEELLFESDKLEELSNEIKEVLEDDVDCCVDVPLFEGLGEITINSIEEDDDVEEYDENVYVTIYLQAEANFEAMNHTAGEDWSPGSSSVSLLITVSAEIPFDTRRRALSDEIILNEITNIEV